MSSIYDTISKSLNADQCVPATAFSIYLPDADAHGANIKNFDTWVERAVRLMSKLAGGTTILPRCLGVWINPDTQALINENTYVIQTLIDPNKLIDGAPAIHEFLCEFGVSTGQKEVLCACDHYALSITNFTNFTANREALIRLAS